MERSARQLAGHQWLDGPATHHRLSASFVPPPWVRSTRRASRIASRTRLIIRWPAMSASSLRPRLPFRSRRRLCISRAASSSGVLSTHRRNYNNVLLTAGRIFGYGCPESVSGNNHAEKKSFRDHAYRRGSTSAEAAGAKIYVAVFSGSTGPDDPLGRTRTAERRDCGAAQHAAGGRQPVAETVFPRTPAGT